MYTWTGNNILQLNMLYNIIPQSWSQCLQIIKNKWKGNLNLNKSEPDRSQVHFICYNSELW